MTAALVGAGCKKKDEIRDYTVTVPAPPAPTHRMLVAIVPEENAAPPETSDSAGAKAAEAAESKQPPDQPDKVAWFFKLVGPLEQVDDTVAPFDEFVSSVRTGKGGLPEWTLPEGWVEDRSAAGAAFGREATIKIGQSAPQLELAVSKLPMPDERFDSWLLVNVNRWRGQMDLPPIALSELDEHTREDKSAAGRAIKVDLRGTFSAPPMAGRAAHAKSVQGDAASDQAAGTPPRDANASSAPGARPDLPFEVEVPDGWKAGRTSGIRVAAYTIDADDGGPGAEVTVIPLSPAAGDLKANVDRWRNEIKLPATTPEELESQTKSIEIDGATADYVHLIGPDSVRPRESTLGVIFRRPDRVWFFKLRGPVDLVAQEKERFEAFVKSVNFKS